MSWHAIVLSNQDVVAGKQTFIQDAFEELLRATSFHPDAAMFCSEVDEKGRIILYFPPKAAEVACTLISMFDGVACLPPSKPVVHLAGHLDAMEQLL